ncbi:MAG: DUF983 domain-containing protein [Opitutaceae bacterium]
MKVSRWQIISRGLRNRCPNCGRVSLFRRMFEVHHDCPACGMSLERGEGFFLGSMSINYGITVFGVLTPILVLYLVGVFPGLVAAVLAVVGAVLFPVLFYRSSRSWWLMAYFFFLPHHLPANARELSGGEDENI